MVVGIAMPGVHGGRIPNQNRVRHHFLEPSGGFQYREQLTVDVGQ